MTKDEAVIVSAYTGILIGSFSPLHEYIEKIMGRPVFTHEIPKLADEIKKRSKADFIKISELLTD